MKMEEVEHPANWATMTNEERREYCHRYDVDVCGQSDCGCATADSEALHNSEKWWGHDKSWDVRHRHRVGCTFKEMQLENAAGEWRKHWWGQCEEKRKDMGPRTAADIRRESNNVPCPPGMRIRFEEKWVGTAKQPKMHYFVVLHFERC